MANPISFNEGARLEALRAAGVLDTPPEPRFDRVARLTARTLRVPIALISFLDHDRQWFKAEVGMDICQSPREHAFCNHTILKDEVMVVPDATKDPRFVANPYVTGMPGIRFYAGAPLATADGFRIGTLCAVDLKPRPALDREEVDTLRELASIVSDELSERRRHGREIAALGKAIERLDEAGQAAQRAKKEFLAMASHELRTPLNAVIGFGEVLAGQMMGPIENKTYAEYAGMIVESGRHLLGVIDSVLQFANAERGEITLQEERLDLDEAIRHCVQALRETARLGEVELVVERRDGPYVLADRHQMIQVLTNLIGNAIKFTGRGGRVTVNASRADGGDVVIAIEDSGIGMTDRQLDAALAAFEQCDARLARNREGMGLGLPLSQRLVRLHGGDLAVASVPDSGTTVEVRLPAWRLLEAAA